MSPDSWKVIDAATVKQAELEGLSTEIYKGRILLFDQLPLMRAIVAGARKHLEAFFAPIEPTLIHEHFDRLSLGRLADEARYEYANTLHVQELWRDLFASIGMHPEEFARDRLILRFHPPEATDPRTTTPTSIQRVPIHRDSWGSNLLAQVNWWAPVYELAPDRTFLMFPKFWNRRISNNSGTFDIQSAAASRKSGTASMKDLIPSAMDELGDNEGEPVLIAPRQIIAFSAQHAHGGIPNLSMRTRVSLDTRTISIADFKRGSGAPNVDGATPKTMTHIFRRMSDKVKLSDI